MPGPHSPAGHSPPGHAPPGHLPGGGVSVSTPSTGAYLLQTQSTGDVELQRHYMTNKILLQDAPGSDGSGDNRSYRRTPGLRIPVLTKL